MCHCAAVDVSNHQQLYVWGVDHLSPRRTSSARELDSHGSTAELHQQAAEQQSSLSGSTADNGPDTSTASNSPVVCAIPTQVKLPEPGARVRRMAAGWAHTLLCTGQSARQVAAQQSAAALWDSLVCKSIMTLDKPMLVVCLDLSATHWTCCQPGNLVMLHTPIP